MLARRFYQPTYEYAASHSQQSRFATATATGGQVAIVGVDGSAVNVATRLEMHNSLRLRRSSVEYTALVPERIVEQVRSVLLVDPGDERCR